MRCSNDEIVVVDKKGDGVPGRCCDKFHCQSRVEKSDCVVNGVYYGDGDQWSSDDSSCETCSCTNGVKLCRKMECHPLVEHCNWVGLPEGNCCPVCLGCRDDDGGEHAIGDAWVKDDCTKSVLEAEFNQ